MPAGIKEAFKSPFNRTNPASQFYNLSSYTRSSNTDSLRNELLQSDFNNQYYLGGETTHRLPNYNPNQRYASNLEKGGLLSEDSQKRPNYNQLENETNSNDTDSSLKNPLHSPIDECDNLINKVLSNQRCRQILKKLLTSEEEKDKLLSSYKKITEAFSEVAPDQLCLGLNQNTIKTVLIYSLGGLLILCILDLFVRLGQILSRPR